MFLFVYILLWLTASATVYLKSFDYKSSAFKGHEKILIYIYIQDIMIFKLSSQFW